MKTENSSSIIFLGISKKYDNVIFTVDILFPILPKINKCSKRRSGIFNLFVYLIPYLAFYNVFYSNNLSRINIFLFEASSLGFFKINQ